LIAVIGIIWAYVPKSSNKGMDQQSQNGYVSSSTDTSDSAINQDMSNLDSQLNDLNSQASNIDSSSTNQ